MATVALTARPSLTGSLSETLSRRGGLELTGGRVSAGNAHRPMWRLSWMSRSRAAAVA
jgi:hypothetical protein